jgi:glucose/mannose transport system permease protein
VTDLITPSVSATSVTSTRSPSAQPPRGPRTGWRFWVLTVVGIVFALPFYVMISAAFKTPKAADVSTMWQLPHPLSVSGLSEAWHRLSPNFFNSFKLVVPATAISSLIGSFNGYLLSKYKFRMSTTMFTLMLVGMFIPYQTVLIPMVRFLSLVHLYGTLPGLILVHVVYGIPITTLIFRNYYVSVPQALVEAAAVDGAGVVRTYRSIILPISLPGFVVAAIFQFTNIWNDFLFGVVVVSDPRKQPVTVALNNLAGNQSVNWNVVMAGAAIAAFPTAVAYIAFGRYYVEGLTAGSVK